jgi:hypothetical protein
MVSYSGDAGTRDYFRPTFINASAINGRRPVDQ